MGFATPPPLLPEIFALHGKWRAADTAVIVRDRKWSWAEFTADCHQFAHGLRAKGVQPEDRVGVLMSNGYPMLQALFGTVAAGAVIVPLNISVADTAAVSMLLDADVNAVVASDDQRTRLHSIADQLPAPVLRIAPSAAEGWVSLNALTHDQPSTLPEIEIDGQALINIIYSSGTTGLPKGIAHDHQGRRDWAYDIALALRYHGGARTLLTIGLYSNISWVAMLSTLLCGGCLVIAERFDAQAFIDTVEREKITHTAMVPIQFQQVVEAVRSRGGADLSSMQAMMSCGSPLREPIKKAVFEVFACGIIELYGLTEGIITTQEPETVANRWSSVGRPLVGTDICIVDEQDKKLPSGQSGEICSRGRIAMPGYWRRPEADLAATYTDSEGRVWLRSGDIGYVDNQGYLFIVDRKKDMILSGGQNIYPQDIEAVVAEHPAVADVAVIGLASEKWGETPVAFVVLYPQDGADPAGIQDWANQRVGKQQRLADIIRVDTLPRNPNGKILKRELRSQYQDRSYP